MRLLVDNNVFVSGLINRSGSPADIVQAVLSGLLSFASSVDQIERLAAVLSRDKYASRFTPQEAAALIRSLSLQAIIVEPRRDITATVDPEDNLILGTAVAGRVDYIVTGDRKHLLLLGQFEGIPIISVADAQKLIANQKEQLSKQVDSTSSQPKQEEGPQF